MNTYKEDIYYIVKVREDIFDPLFNKTTIHRTFCGKLVNHNNGRFYFELNGSTVTAKSLGGFYSKVDLGIVKYHFELGAGTDNFKWA